MNHRKSFTVITLHAAGLSSQPSPQFAPNVPTPLPRRATRKINMHTGRFLFSQTPETRSKTALVARTALLLYLHAPHRSMTSFYRVSTTNRRFITTGATVHCDREAKTSQAQLNRFITSDS
ncbi:unnamed protein product [Ectocarpus sp. 8 AP-2014]